MDVSSAFDGFVTTTTPAVASVDTAQPWYPYVFGLYLFETFALMFGNLLVVVAYWITPQLQTPPCMLIFNLSLVDCAVSLLSFPWVVFTYTEAGLKFVVQDKWACLTSMWAIAFISTSSMMTIFFLSVDRFLAILFPYTYYKVVTENNVRRVNILAWVFPAGLLALPFFNALNIWMPGRECVSMYVYNPVYNSFVVSTTRAALLISCAAMNVAVCFVAFRKSRTVIASAPPNLTSSPPPRMDFKLTKMLLTVVGAFFATWAAYLGLTVYFTMRRGRVTPMVSAAQDFSILGVGMNSVFNPLIYAWKNEKFRSAFKRILFRNQRVHVTASDPPQVA